MAAPSLVRLAVAALAVVALASCSDDEPEPVATGGGLELASTTTEQPRITEPERSTTTTSTTTSTSTTTTTTTSTTTTTTEPPGPTVEELAAALPPPDALPGGQWSRTEAPTEAAGEPGPLCEGSTVATPLSGLLDEVAIAEGVSARYDRADSRSSLQVVLAPLRDAEPRIAEAQAEVARCAPAAVTALQWPTLGDGSLAFGRAATAEAQGRTWALARVGEVVLGLSVTIFPADGVAAAPPPTDAELHAFVQAALAAAPAGT